MDGGLARASIAGAGRQLRNRIDCVRRVRSDCRDSSDCPVMANRMHVETAHVDKFDWRERFPHAGVLRFPSVVRFPHFLCWVSPSQNFIFHFY